MVHMPSHPDLYRMAFGDHLDELRRRLIYGLIAPIPLAMALFFMGDLLLEWLLMPLQTVQEAYGFPRQLQVLSPPEFLVMKIKVSIIGALVLSLPWLLWQAWLFIGPGLFPRERRFVHFLLPGSAILVLAGTSLMYYIMLPLMLEVLMSIGGSLPAPATLIETGNAATTTGLGSLPILESMPDAPAAGSAWVLMPQGLLQIAVPESEGVLRVLQLPLEGSNAISQIFRLTSYVNFVLILLAGIALAFQMPLVIVLLGWTGIVNVKGLKANRKWALLVCSIIAAITTPADVISMVFMLMPLYCLYELGILLLQFVPASRLAGDADAR
ncbi:MAG: twin-arginine translocase subunit TatC [Phycisphaerales bacterium]|nr:twin-arginine translocase subunit TatC [Phycisphaerales bacterium]